MQDSVLVPKKLLFTAPNTPAASPIILAPAVSEAAVRCASPSSSGRYGVVCRTPTPPPPCPVVRYGLPQDPEAYYSRFTSTSKVRYGLIEDLSSEDEDEEEEAQGIGQGSLVVITQPAHIAEISPVEDMMSRIKLSWQNKAEQWSSERASRLKDAFRAADQELAAELGTISASMQKRQLEFAQADAQQASQQLQARTKKLQELQRSHDKAAAMQQQQVERLQRQAEEEEAARRREEEERQRRADEAAAKVRAEEEARKAAEVAEVKAKEENAQKAVEQAKAATDAKQAAGKAAGNAAAAGKVSAAARCMRCAPEARAFESDIENRAKVVTDDVQALLNDESLKKARRDIEKKMTVHVQQISATLDQVAKKCYDVYQVIASQTTPQWRHYAILMFATKLVRQSDLVTLNNKAAFPLATVLVKVSTQFPELMDVTLHLMQRECCFAVPCAFTQRDEATGTELTPTQLRRLLGYKELDDPNKPGSKVYESDDAYVQRVEGIMFLYGAILQVPEPRNPHGLEYGWRWLARFLNAIPASRAPAKALISFLRAVGYSMYCRFKGQFIKVLKCMHDEYLPELKHAKEADIESVRTMLEHFLQRGQYNTEPEGAAMPKIDISSLTRA